MSNALERNCRTKASLFLNLLVFFCVAATLSKLTVAADKADDLLVVDCLLPGQIRQLGSSKTYLSARRPAKTTLRDCRIRGGEYAAYDRANYATALKVWLPQAKNGNTEAQLNVGEIYEKGLGLSPDHRLAAHWYRQAAEAGDARAQINLGHLYEEGLGVEQNPTEALKWYRKASGLSDNLALDPGTLSTEIQKLPTTSSPTQFAPRQKGTSAQPQTKLEGVSTNSAENKNGLTTQEAHIAAPSITLIDPQLSTTRGEPVVKVRASIAERQIVGRVNAAAGLLTLTVNDLPQNPNNLGIFQARIPVSAPQTPVTIIAIDQQGKRSELGFTLQSDTRTLTQQATAPAQIKTSPRPLEVNFGKYYALVIGINNYRYLPKLETAVSDAESVANLLEERYGFKTVKLIDASRYQILLALNNLREKLTKNDNLLIYYAGHGELDKVNMRGYWLPTDAELGNTANWISNVSVTDILNIINAKQIMIIVDSCYSGALTRSALAQIQAGMTDQERMNWLRTMANKRSRTVLTSGGLQPTLDAGGGGHSVFAKALLDVLSGNNDVMEGRKLYKEVAARVAYAASNMNFEQVPEYAPVKHTGHEGGDFFLVPNM